MASPVPAKYKVGLVQMAMSSDTAANLQAAIAKVEEAAAAGARLVCLPELFRSRYFAQREDAALFDLAEPRSEEHTSELQSLAYLVCRLLLEKKKKNKNKLRTAHT